MLKEFLKYIEENNLVKKGDKILAAVSGGIDSMVMADLFLKSGLLYGIAHCNFSLRGKESDGDEKLVRKFAEDHSIPIYSKRFRTREYAKTNRISIEMAARDLRYNWFRNIMIENGFDSVAVAHNLNDNSETFLLNLIRGTGLPGLSGMKNSSNHIIRPLLFAPRSMIESYCRENQISFRDDKTNEDIKFIRNKIRHKVIPVLREINPSIDITLKETAERVSGINEVISELVAGLRDSIFTCRGKNVIINISKLEAHRPGKALMYEIFRPFGITGALQKDLQNIISGRTGSQLFTVSHRFLKNRKEIIISEISDKESETFQADNLTDLKKVPIIASVKTVKVNQNFKISDEKHSGSFDAARLSFPVTIRKWKEGDYFYPFGMKNKKKLSDYFIDRKLSRFEKEKVYILESEGKIAWIIGERIDNRFRITKTTVKALVIKSE